MKHIEDKLGTTSLPEIYYQIWQPEKAVKAIIILIHGLGEHGGRYGGDFAKFYTDAGFAVVAPDLPGHGKTPGIPGHVSDPNLFLDVLDQMIETAGEFLPKKPIFLYGHSMGGGITLWYSLDRAPKVSGVIVTSPSIGTKEPVPAIKRAIAKIMNSVVPTFRMDNGLDVNQLSRDKKVVEAYVSDPLVNKLISARLAMMVLTQGDWLLANAKKNTADMLVMIGSDEGIVNKNAVDQFCQTAPHVTYKVWPNLYHEIHNEPEKKDVFDFTLGWINKHI